MREVPLDVAGVNFHFLRWAPDGRSVLAVGRDNRGRYGHLFRIDLETGAGVSIASPDSGLIFNPNWTPDGRAVYFLRSQRRGRRIMRLDLATGSEHEVTRVPDAYGLTLSPDGQELAFRAGDTIMVMSAGGGPARPVVQAPGIRTLTWSGDGRYVLYGAIVPGGQRELTQLWRVPRSGGQPEQLDLAMPQMLHLRVHPDGRHIAFTARVRDERSEVWAIEHLVPADTARAPAGRR